jgi:hypothetical protein
MREVLLIKSWLVLDAKWMTSKVFGNIVRKQEDLHGGPKAWDPNKINELADDAASLFFSGDANSLHMILQDVDAVIPPRRDIRCCCCNYCWCGEALLSHLL